jgi:hypothetical protein
MLFPFFGQSAVSNRETDGHNDQDDLHCSDEDIYDPDAPACDTDSYDHVDSEYPGILVTDSLAMINS